MAVERYAPDWRPRFAEAYRLQNKAFLHFVRTGSFSPVAADAWDGHQAAAVAEASGAALRAGRRIAVAAAERPALHQ